MKVNELRQILNEYPDDLEVRFLKYKSQKPLGFWHTHEWYLCKNTYRQGGPKDEEFLAIQVEDDD